MLLRYASPKYSDPHCKSMYTPAPTLHGNGRASSAWSVAHCQCGGIISDRNSDAPALVEGAPNRGVEARILRGRVEEERLVQQPSPRLEFVFEANRGL